MPPFGYRKRERSPSPAPAPQKSKSKKETPTRAKPTLFETADATSKKQSSLEDNKKFLDDLGDHDDDESLSEAESVEFEDVAPPAKRRKTAAVTRDSDDAGEGEDDEMEWEDAIQEGTSSHATPATSKPEAEITDISISMNDDGSYVEPLVSAATGKKGPSKRERQVRILSHCLHVQTLMWHNTIRNSWLNDKEVQRLLVDGLTEGVKREVKSWKEVMGTLEKSEGSTKKQTSKGKGKQGKKGKGKNAGRDWNETSEYVEHGAYGGDPLLRLLKVLTAYWRKRFTVTAPALRKQGYKPLKRLRDEIRAWGKDHNDFDDHGERVENVEEFRKLAKECEGSRDVGAQLFVALLRGLGLEARLVANLQPVGIGWSKAEDADAKKPKKNQEKSVEVESDSDAEVAIKGASASAKRGSNAKKVKEATKATVSAPKAGGKASKPTRRSTRGNKTDPISLDDSDSPLSEPPSEPEVMDPEEDDDDDISVIDITPPTPKKKPIRKFDRDMAFPNYWVEVCSPVSHKYYPVDPIVLSTIASNDDLLQTFEPRGKKAEKAKQVICYTIAYSPDGTAKDVTVRYLKRHQLPGKTKGVRMSIEKVPIYNRKGKVKRYEEYDWFKQVMLSYERQEQKRTTADDLEEQTDLRPYKPDKEEKKQVAKESLQGYKQSADFVLEQHLRREEAILPGSEPVKYFTAGKGDKAQELPVYSRDDVVTCKTVESWHKEGREIKIGEQPLKYVPMRAVTLVKKREMEESERETGEKMKQGLYSEAQTDWIIPPPIQNGVIPRNAFGNIDVYVPTMVPKGAIHLPLKGSAKLCKRLEIDFAEACTGFEFGKQRAVPVLTGVVVAEENAQMVRDAWKADQQELKRKEDTKRTAASLHWWRKMLLGLRVLERMRTEYAEGGGTGEDVNPFIRKKKQTEQTVGSPVIEQDGAGGFFPPGYDEEEVPQARVAGGGFLTEDNEDEAVGGGFMIGNDINEEEKGLSKHHAPVTPVSLQSKHNATNGDSELEGTLGRTTERDASKPVVDVQAISPAKLHRRSSARSRGKLKTTISSEGDSESALSNPSASSNNDSGSEVEASERELTPPPTRKKAKTKSPRVVVNTSTRKRGRSAKKSTPVRSQYFNHSDDGEDDDDEESEVEVVRPRNTTARTRTKR